MDDRRFDALVRSLASGQNRRTVLKGLLGLGGLAAGAGLQGTEAARRPTPTPTAPKCPGRQTWKNGACTCPSGSNKCGPACCDAGVSVCCDNACCQGECYGEELCCPTGQLVCNGACCAPGDDCTGGLCTPCTPCGGELCCGGDTPVCCQGSFGSMCVAAGEPCCSSAEDCPPADTCTPAQCLEGNICNTASSCGGDHKVCCDGACLNGIACCSDHADCVPYHFCEFPLAHDYECENGACVDYPNFCIGIDKCYVYGCDEATVQCTMEFIPGCCNEWNPCGPVDPCTPGLCLEDNTCNIVSNCAAGEHCCDGGACSQGGSCGPTGCTIDGVPFPPCVDGCNICVATDGGTLCGCAVTTTQRCTSSDLCKELFGDAICAGTPDSAVCVQASGPLN